MARHERQSPSVIDLLEPFGCVALLENDTAR